MKDITLADYIKRTTEQLEKDKQQPQEQPEHNDYPVWPEDDGTDSKRNPYSPV